MNTALELSQVPGSVMLPEENVSPSSLAARVDAVRISVIMVRCRAANDRRNSPQDPAAGIRVFLHAADQSVLRHIARREVEEALESGAVIEDYPSDKYGPSCLVLGYTKAGRRLHIQCTHPVRTRIKIITVYEPDPGEWVDFKKRSQ